jgi:hypothetical protein
MFVIGLFSSFTPFIILAIGYLLCIITFSSPKELSSSINQNEEHNSKIIKVEISKSIAHSIENTFEYQYYSKEFTKPQRLKHHHFFSFSITQYLKTCIHLPIVFNLLDNSFLNIPPPLTLL